MASNGRFETEWSVVLAVCSVIADQAKLEKIRGLLLRTIHWPELLTCADHHGITFLLHQALSEVAETLPTDKMQQLQQRYRTNIHRTMFFTRELIRILDCLEAISVDVIPYKGVILAETLYGNMALRQMGDIDLLIRLRDFARIRESIRELGFTPHLSLSALQEQAYLRSAYEYSFDSPAGRNLLELQWALQPRFYAVDMDMAGLFQRCVPVTIAGRSMKTLSPEDSLIVLSLHAAKHAWGRLIWLCDIARIMSLRNLNWEWIQQRAVALGIARILYVTLILANRMLGAPIPSQLGTSLAEDSTVLAIAKEIDAQIASGAACDIESLSYFRLMLRLRERPSDQMRFLSRLVFTPGPGEWSAVRLPPVLFPLYRVVRLSRLAARMVRA